MHGTLATPFAPASLMKNLVSALSFSLLLLAAAQASAISVSCEADYGGKTHQLTITPASDVFSFETVNVGDRFRFQVQYLEDRAKFKTFVYELKAQAPTLIHASEHKLSPQNCAQKSDGLGLNKVYSSDLEREMFFQCFARCD